MQFIARHFWMEKYNKVHDETENLPCICNLIQFSLVNQQIEHNYQELYHTYNI